MPLVTSAKIRFTAREFERMLDADVFGTTRVELINGRVYRMTQKEAHVWAVSKGIRALNAIVPADEWLITQGTLRLDDRTMVDPDFLWLTCPMGTPAARWPAPLLVVEVSDTTYRKDSGIKLRTYAMHGIADYWIVHLSAGRIEVCRSPQNLTGQLRDCRYMNITHHHRGQTIPLLNRPAVTIAVDDLLP